MALLSPGPRARADAPLETGSSPNPGLVVVFPDLPVELLELSQERIPSPLKVTAERRVIQMEVSDPRFIDPLRIAQLRGRVLADAVDPELCRDDGPRFSELLEQASRALDFVKLDEAGVRLNQARIAFSCGREVASEEALARYLFLSAVMRLSRGHDDGNLLVSAFGIASRLPDPNDYPKAVQEAYQRAIANTAAQKRVPVLLQLGEQRDRELAGLLLRIDGEMPISDTLHLTPGVHFLQLCGTDGQAIAGTSVTLSAGPATAGAPRAGPVDGNLPPEAPADGPAPADRRAATWPPGALKPPSSREMETLLLGQVQSQRLAEEVMEAAGAVMALGRSPWLLLVAPGDEPGTALSVWFPGGELQRHTLSPGGRSNVVRAADPAASPAARHADAATPPSDTGSIENPGVSSHTARTTRAGASSGSARTKDPLAASGTSGKDDREVSAGTSPAGDHAQVTLPTRAVQRARPSASPGSDARQRPADAADTTLPSELTGHERRPRPGVYLAYALSVGAVVLGGYYGYSYYRLTTGLEPGDFPTQDSFNLARQRANTAGVAALICAGGALVSLGLSVTKAEEPVAGRPATLRVSLGARAAGMGLEIGGTW